MAYILERGALVNPFDEDLSELVREGMKKACRDFTDRVAPLGFRRTRDRSWVRRRVLTADVIHFHRQGSSYGAPINASVGIRVELSLRILNDPAPSGAVIGPWSDVARTRSGRYHLRFNAKSGSTYERCIDDLVRFLVEHGESWFRTYESAETLLALPDSMLPQSTKELLKLAMSGQASADNIAATLRQLGLKS
jgi:hypothetical protein